MTSLENKPKAAGYVRVSTTSQAKEGESLDTQRKQIQAHASANGWRLLKIYADEGISGAKAENRPGLRQLMEDATKGEFQHVIISKFSRFARNVIDLLTYQKKLQSSGVSLQCIKDNIDPSTNSGKLMLTLLGAIAEWEREMIREQMHENRMVKWADNRTFIGHPPFGYRWNKDTNKLEIHQAEAEIYHRIVKWYVEQGLACRDITNRLRKDGIRSSHGKWFSNATIGYIFKNPAYYGHYVTNTRQYKDHPEKGAGKLRSKELKPASEHIEFPIPALITKQEWDRIQERTAFNKVKSKRTTWSTDYWLRDIVECGRCGGKMNAHRGNTRKDGSWPRYYTCYWASTSEKTLAADQHERCHLPYINADALEEAVWQRVLTLVRHPYHQRKTGEHMDSISQEFDDKIARLEGELASLDKEHKMLKKKYQLLFDLYGNEKIDQNDLAEQLQANKQDQKANEGLRKEMRDSLTQLHHDKGNTQEMFQFIRDRGPAIERMLQDMERLDPQDRKRVIESVVDGSLHIEFDEVLKWDYLTEEGSSEHDDQPIAKPSEIPLSPRKREAIELTLGAVFGRPVHLPKQPGVTFSANFRFNPEIFQWLMDSGKISPIDPDPRGGGGKKPGKGLKSKGLEGASFTKNGWNYFNLIKSSLSI